MATTITPNMLLTVPVVGQEPGPDWASDINNCMTVIDQHDHTPGSGVQITPSGLNINSALTLNNNSLTSVASTVFEAQSAISTNLALYVKGSEIYYRDGAGNEVQLTNGGSVNAGAGSITGLPSGTASVVYSSGNQTYTFQSATSTAANLDAGSILLRNLTPNSTFALTLKAPTALSTNYDVTLPSLPASKKIVTMTSGGAIAADYGVDNVSIEIASSNLQVKDDGITTPKILDGAVTNAKLTAATVNVSASSGANTYTNQASPVFIPNMSNTLTTTGRPVVVTVVPDGVSTALIRLGTSGVATFRWIIDGTPAGDFQVQADSGVGFPPGSFGATFTSLSAAPHTIQLALLSTVNTLFWNNVVMTSYEIK